MNIDEKLRRAAVIGAAGKMGRGIALLLLREMIATDLRLKRKSRLYLVDNSAEGLITLTDYLNTQMLKFAERNINQLREWYANSSLVDNSEIIQQFLEDCRHRAVTSCGVSFLEDCNLVFEAVFENLEIKSKVYSELKKVCPPSCCYFTNTSSIPISSINSANELNGQIIGFHFYNPPAVQKLVELIRMKENSEELVDFSRQLIERLGKTLVPSNDFAGFIGNGHFIREGCFYLSEIENMELDQEHAITLINSVTHDLLVRPMGIFQLIDYVGLDIFKMICSTMSHYLSEDFSCSLIERMVSHGIIGGQYGDGSQKDGFFTYEKGEIAGVYSETTKEYIPLTSTQLDTSDLQPPSWKALSRSKEKKSLLKNYFKTLASSSSEAAVLAKKYIAKSRSICRGLVDSGVASGSHDVNSVLINGFYHLYGADSELTQNLEAEQ